MHQSAILPILPQVRYLQYEKKLDLHIHCVLMILWHANISSSLLRNIFGEGKYELAAKNKTFCDCPKGNRNLHQK